MQELVDEEGNLTLDQYDQHTGVDGDETVSSVSQERESCGHGRKEERQRSRKWRGNEGDDAKGRWIPVGWVVRDGSERRM